MLSFKKIFKVGALLGFAGLTLLLAGCGGESPADVAVAFYQAANRGDYAKAESYLDLSVRVMIKEALDFPKTLDAVTKRGSIKRIEVEEVQKFRKDGNEAAQVMLMLYYADGTQSYDLLMLYKGDKGWKIFTSRFVLGEYFHLPVR